MQICFYAWFLLRDQSIIERMRKVMSAALVWTSPSKLSCHIKKICCQWLVTAQNLHRIKSSLTLALNQLSVWQEWLHFSSSEQVAASRDCNQLGNTLRLYLFLPVRPTQHVPERCPKCTAIDFAVKTFGYLLNSLQGWLPDELHGLELELNFELCCLRAEVRHSLIITTVREESQVTPQGSHR